MKLSKLILLFFISACGYTEKLTNTRIQYQNNNFTKISKNKSNGNLDLLISADSAFQNSDYLKSDFLFEEFNKKNINITSFDLLGEIGKIAFGQNSSEYKPYMMDTLFVSYYQILGSLFGKREENTRVIINQSYARQQKMSKEYKKLLSNRNRKQIPEKINNEFSKWNSYFDIMNPALTYISGLYFLNKGENENARQYLSRTVGMVPNNNFVKEDLKLAEQNKSPKNIAWLIIETGFAPRLEENRIDFPWFLNDKTRIISVVSAKPNFYECNSDSKLCFIPENSKLLANVDSMFMTEFKEYEINNIIRSITKIIANNTLQSILEDNTGSLGVLIGFAYSVATTNAETRSWVTLPQNIYLLRIKKNKNNILKLSPRNSINLDYNGNHLIYIRNGNIKITKI